jgi:hypothetical protein
VDVLDKTISPMGARGYALKRWIAFPLKDVKKHITNA